MRERETKVKGGKFKRWGGVGPGSLKREKERGKTGTGSAGFGSTDQNAAFC